MFPDKSGLLTSDSINTFVQQLNFDGKTTLSIVASTLKPEHVFTQFEQFLLNFIDSILNESIPHLLPQHDPEILIEQKSNAKLKIFAANRIAILKENIFVTFVLRIFNFSLLKTWN